MSPESDAVHKNGHQQAGTSPAGQARTETFAIRPVTSDAAWREAVDVREEVFVREQHCPPDEEWDAFDDVSRHFVGYLDGRAVATARWRTATVDGQVVAKLERFAVRSVWRGRGYGRQLVAHLIEDARRAGFTSFYIHAQAHLASMYGSVGFEAVGEPFEEVGIPHIAMIRREPTRPAD